MGDILDTDYGLAAYYIRRLDKIYLWDKELKYPQQIKFKVDDNEIIADKLPSNYGFIMDSVEGENFYFDENKNEYIFGFKNDNDFRNTRFVKCNK